MKIEDLIKNEVCRIDKDAKVILFGSRARDTHSKGSDWDILILLDQKVDEKLKRKIRDAIFEVEL